MKIFSFRNRIKLLALLICAFLTVYDINIGSATTIDDTDTVLNWAETKYPQFYPNHQTTQIAEPWLYRYYPETDIYVGTNTNDNSIYFWVGPLENKSPTYIDSLSNLLNKAQGSAPNSASGLQSITLPPFLHDIDIYATTGATKAIIFLHGGGGTNYHHAYELGLNLVNSYPTTSTINWAWLENQKILAVFPQGQSIAGNGYTWSNHVMDSGQDDVAFLQTLAAYIKNRYAISDIYLAGHSNGGMMANRMWCESSETFNGYIAIAGPLSSYYLTTPCEPPILQPYYGIVGEKDNVLQVEGSRHEELWHLNTMLVNLNQADFITTELIGEWYSYQIRTQVYCGEIPTETNKISNGSVETWNNCDGNLKLQHVLSSEHSIQSFEFSSGSQIIDLISTFINRN